MRAIVFLILGIGCLSMLFIKCGLTSRELTINEYVAWIEDSDNGLHTTKTIGDYSFELQFKPAEYVVIRENMMIPSSLPELNLQTNDISEMQYFTLRINREDGLDPLKGNTTDADLYSSRLVYFTGAMQNDIRLLNGSDTLSCMLFHYEPTSGIDRRATFLLGFENPSGAKDVNKTLLFEARELGTGPINITIDKENINNIPLIKFN